MKTFIDWFFVQYLETHGREYIVQGGKDGRIVRQLLGQLDADGVDPLAELQRAARGMFADPWGRPNASIGLLSSQINKWRSGGNASGGDARDDDLVARRDWAIMEAEREARDQAVEEPALAGGGTA